MKKFSISVISIILAISFFFVNSIPVFADYDINTYPVESWQVTAYEYWRGTGYTLVTQETNSTIISIPQYVTNTGNTNQTLQCEESSVYDGGYACFFRNNSTGQIYGTWEQNTTLSHQETVQNVSVNGVYTPWLSTSSYIHETGYNDNHAIWLPGTGSEGDSNNLYISFLSNLNPQNTKNYTGTNAVDNLYLKLWSLNGDSNFTVERISLSAVDVGPAYYFNSIKVTNNNNRGTWVTIDFPKFKDSTLIIPVYTGTGNDLPDYARNTVGIPTRTEQFLESLVINQNQTVTQLQNVNTNINSTNQIAGGISTQLSSGNVTSQAAQSQLSNSNTTLNNRVDQMNNIETEYNSDLNAALDDIDISTDLVQHTGFTNAALWVSAQFNRLVIGTPFELVITFSLITGLALVLIGKMRG